MPPTVRDRTQEFFATISSYENVLQSRTHSPNRSKRHAVSQTSIDQSSRILNLAQTIAQTIAHNIQNVHQLQRLSEQTTNFHDERPRIQSLIVSIKMDVTQMAQDLKELQTFIHQSFSKERKCNLKEHNMIDHHSQICNVLLLRYSSLMNLFKDVCHLSSQHLLRQKKQREKFGKRSQSRNIPRNRFANRKFQKTRGVGYDDEHQSLLSSENNNNNNSNNNMRMQVQKAFPLSEYYDQRAEMAQVIESQLAEVVNMVSHLATFVDEQRHTIITINTNIVESIDNVEGAIAQLQKYLASLSGNRWLMIKVFALLIFFAVIFTIFIA